MLGMKQANLLRQTRTLVPSAITPIWWTEGRNCGAQTPSVQHRSWTSRSGPLYPRLLARVEALGVVLMFIVLVSSALALR